MPPWQPNWNDVEFDQAKAAAAARECRTSASTLDAILGGRASLAATDHWTGRYRGDYDTEEPALFTELRNLRDDLLTLAGRIEAAATEAAEEQAARERERQRWRDERDREQADDPPSGGGRVPVAV